MYEAIRNGVQHGLQGQIQVQSGGGCDGGGRDGGGTDGGGRDGGGRLEERGRRQENGQVDSQEEPDPDRILVHAEQNGSKTK